MRTARDTIALVAQYTVATTAAGSERRTSSRATFFSSAEKAARSQPRWIMRAILRIIGLTCWCSKTTWVFKDTEGYYIRCLDCGRRLAYNGPLLAYSKRR